MPIPSLHRKPFFVGLLIFFLHVLQTASFATPAILWKTVLDSAVIKTSRLEELAISKGAPFPFKAVMTEKSIYILDKKGKVGKKISLTDYDKASLSDDGATMAVMKGKEIAISGLNGNAVGIVNIESPQPVVLPQHVGFELSPDGKYIVVISNFTDTLYFYDRKGGMLSKHKFDDLRGAQTRFS